MSTEEEKEELRLYEKYAQNSMFGVLGSLFDQTSIYKYMLETIMKFGNVPNTIITTSRRRTSARSVMDKVMEFNRCMDLKSEDYNEEDWKDENIVCFFKIDELHENKTIEITLEELKKELSDGKEGDTDSIWQSEMMQDPCPSQEEIESAGDGPLEVGRQMHEAMERLGFGYENQDGSRRNQCERCARIGCPQDRQKEANEGKYCEGYIKEGRLEIKETKCTVCKMILDEPENFPKSFPDKWKVCCYCSEVWARFNGFRESEYIHIGFNWVELKERWEKFGKKLEEVFEL